MTRSFFYSQAIIFLFFAYSVCANVKNHTIYLDDSSQIANDTLACFSEPVMLKKITCRSSNGISASEILYLLGVEENQIITPEKFCIGLERLKKKNIFSLLHLKIEHFPDGISLDFFAEGFWIVKSIKVTGVSLGRQSIIHLYQLRIGERFSKERHQKSLDDIVKDLGKKGYLDASVHASFNYNALAKTVDVNLCVVKGSLYFIDTVHLKIVSDHNSQEKKSIYDFLYKKSSKSLLYKPYSQKLIFQKIEQLQKTLINQGFVYAKINSTISHNFTNKTIAIDLIATFEGSQKVNFLGNVFFPSAFLMENIMQCTHTIGIVPPTILAEEMIDLYRSKGFFNIKIDTTQDIQNYHFIINEGVRTRINSCVIKGSKFVTPDYLSNRFFKHLLYSYADEKKIKQAIKACFMWYKSQGFWDMQILKKEYISTKKNHTIALSIVIEEGPQRRIKNIVVEGFPEFKKNLLIETSDGILQDKPLSELILSNQKMLLEKECKKNGYNKPSVSYELVEKDGFYDVIWHVKCGRKMQFGKIILKGNSSVDHKKFLKLVVYKEGDVWTKERIHEIYDKFRYLGVYKSVGVQQSIIQEPHQLCDVIINLEEDDPFEVKLRFGFQQISKNFAFKKGSSYKVGGGFIWKNPFDRLDLLIVDSTITRFERRTYASYKQPLFFSIPIETVLKGYSNAYQNPVTMGSRKILYEALQDGLLVGLTSKQEHVQIGITTGFEWMKIKNISVGLSRVLRFEPQLIDERVPYWFSEPTLFINYVDHDVNPKNGFFLFASLKTMIPFNLRATGLLKLMIENGYYFSWRSLTTALRIRFGNIFMQNFETIMPPERFYLGGANSLRGYQPDKCPPLGTYVDEDGNTQWVSQGGKSMINANMEIRFPLPLQNLQGALLQDFGVLAPNIYEVFKTFKPLAATGFGIRYITPLGPLRFDIGWKWHKQYEQDVSYAWFLTFGYAW